MYQSIPVACVTCLFRSSCVSDVDGVACLDPALSGFTSADNLDTTASSPSYPSSPDLSSPRPHDPKSDPARELVQLRSQVESQHKVIAHLQRLLHKTRSTAEVLSVTSDPASCEEEEERAATKARISQLTTELERERTIARSNESASPARRVMRERPSSSLRLRI